MGNSYTVNAFTLVSPSLQCEPCLYGLGNEIYSGDVIEDNSKQMAILFVLLLLSSEVLFFFLLTCIYTANSLYFSFNQALKGILVGKGFKIGSPQASNTRETVHCWVGHYEDHFRCSNISANISDRIIQDQQNCFTSRSYIYTSWKKRNHEGFLPQNRETFQ